MGGWAPLGYVRQRPQADRQRDQDSCRCPIDLLALRRRYARPPFWPASWQQKDSATARAGRSTRARSTSFSTTATYVGEAVHKGTAYPGEHEPIIDRKLWDEVHAS